MAWNLSQGNSMALVYISATVTFIFPRKKIPAMLIQCIGFFPGRFVAALTITVRAVAVHIHNGTDAWLFIEKRGTYTEQTAELEQQQKGKKSSEVP